MIQATIERLKDAMAGKPKAARSGRWPKVRRAWLVKHGRCAACGSQQNLNVHHKVPVHVDASLELEPSNLITLCEGPSACHFTLGHAGDWRARNEHVEDDAALMLRRRQERKYE